MLYVGALLWAAVGPAARTHAQPAGWVIQGSDVRVLCPLTVGGSFEARTRMLSGSIRPGVSSSDAWAGELAVPLDDLDTGIALRNQHLRDTYLEVGKGPEYSRAILTEIRPTGFERTPPVGKGTFTARLRLHGVERMVTGQADVRRNGERLRVRASFPVVLEQFAIAKPRYLGVGVRDEVTVQVSFDISVEGAR
jgi:hypothetical protein